MNSKLILRINNQKMLLILMGIMLIEGNYWALLPKLFISAHYRYILWGIMLALTVVVARGKMIKSVYLLPWILYLIMILFRNQEFAHGEYLNSERIILCLLAVFVCTTRVDWILSIPKLIASIGILNVFATLVFYLNNSLYEKFVSLTYGVYQNGTNNGQYGYRAALADHYSQNGTYIAIVLIVLLACFFVLNERKRKKKFWIFVLCCLAVIALLLTGKRAHLLFAVSTAVSLYYIANPKRRVGKTFKLMLVIVVVSFTMSLLIEYIPELAVTFERLQSVGTDSASRNRIIMWQYAVDMIKQFPLFGIGWWGFRYETGIINILNDAVTGCHNIYIEITANCGLIGLLILMFAVISSLLICLKNINCCSSDRNMSKYKGALLTSAAIQIFCLMYGFTGNVIFDRTFHFYMVAVCTNLAFTVYKKRLRVGEGEYD